MADAPETEQRMAAPHPTLVRTPLGILAAVGTAIARVIPERLLVAGAEAAGEIWYRLTPERAARARRNLRRVVTYLVAHDLAGPSTRRAADDDAALERLVRRAFRHSARYYLELARPPAFSADEVARRLVIGPPEVARSLRDHDRTMLIGLHFGAIEMPIRWVGLTSGRTVAAPMEEVGDPGLQEWFVRSRGRMGVRIFGVSAARRELLAELARGGVAGIVGDRDLTGGGMTVDLFGHPAKLPLGPAMLAVETGAQIVIGAVWRVRGGRYVGRLLNVPVPEAGTRRERVTAIVAAEARAIEQLVANAPEQWWACFQPIWPDLEEAAA